MRCNIFTFGDTFWRQISGTAMGCPPPPSWANTFYALCESIFLPQFQDNLALYQRFIDDVLGLWLIINPSTNDATWTAFCAAMNNMDFELEWIVSPPSQPVDYMDLSLSIQNARITTTLYEKPSDHHLYTPPHSGHPPGLLGGIVFGMVNRLYTLVSDEASIKTSIIASFRHLQRRDYLPRDLHPLFQSAIKRSKENALHPPPAKDPADLQKVQFFHIGYHPMNLPAHTIQSAWRNTISNPPNKIPLSENVGHQGVVCGIDRLIVAYHRPPNLSNLLSYRKLKNTGPPLSSYL
jgi:hypothetical protein